MINVLHLIDTTGPGGAETVFTSLLENLDKGSFRHFVVLRGEGWVADQVKGLGLSPLILDSKGSFNIRYLISLIKLIKRERIDLIHAHLLGSNVYGAASAIICRKAMIATFHGNVDVAANERLIKTKFRLINIGSRAIVCVSKRLQEELSARSPISEKKLRLIYNGVDPARFSRNTRGSLRQELGLPAEAIVIISVGNVRAAKGYQVLIKAAEKIHLSEPTVHFVVVGHKREDLYQQLVAQMKEAKVESNVHFLGFRSDTSELLPQADMFLLPSTSEGFSISTVEAMMAGVPVIATRSGGPEEILVDGITGLLIPTEDPGGIVSAIRRLEDKQFASRLAHAALRESTKRFSKASMIQAYEKLYAELAAML
ncbi:glycosyl transferase [Marinobacter sp. CP1]|jgi:glycosyltransferase involved in cell wall biosynthesis|uniref:glycosyltransferase n=1 Tax=unclassified Marinobacter TaxID=83889 RepID=UPI00069DDD2C|nr:MULTISPECIES: glycosyltransferase [unclassified Marinobacter]AKV94699.1 glycosyl transferase [Marinobacter sp. CP1]